MHVLLTNDDGPLNDSSCPYMKYLVDEINAETDWDLSIVVPNQQRSWIGKAHFAGKTLTTTYIYTKYSTATPNPKINAYEGPFNLPQDKYAGPEWQEWCLVNSTPAACADLGIHHIYNKDKGPIDLVVSGPNFGKNSSNLYILTSGTVGAAMEAVTHGVKSIAVSYAFNNLNHDYHILKEAAKISVKLIKKLYGQLQNQDNIDIFSVNVPLIPSLELGKTKIQYAPVLKNYWNSIYAPAEDLNEHGQQQFTWNPDFKKVYKDGLNDFNHTDSRVLLNEGISVTPLKASFNIVEPLDGEISLDDEEDKTPIKAIQSSDQARHRFLITIPETAYIYKPLVDAFSQLSDFQITSDISILKDLPKDGKIFHYGEYEDLDIDLIGSNPESYFLPSYIYRKALIRKHFLANTVHHFVAKHPDSILVKAVPESYQLEVDYAEFLDDSLDDAYELRDEINAGGKTWILKPSMSDKGQGIRLFKTVDQLQEIFDSFEEEPSDDEEEEEEKEVDDKDNGVILSQLRHFIVQEYKSSPLLLSHYDNKKFHLRTYVVCSGNLKVYVYKNILSLFAASTYQNPNEVEDDDEAVPMDGHLTNTCLQESDNPLVVPFWKLEDANFKQSQKEEVFSQVCAITKELFIAATSVDKMNFQPLDNAIELFGIDYLVNDDYSVSLLEVNSYPDFKQTGEDLKELIYELFDRVVKEVVNPLVTGEKSEVEGSTLVEVLDQ
ncbi:tubulin-tyrosine ligase family-domain-containing protein [Scheffersomyces xylosifermentans]|uniref:tubulin-tyrosine ligase family-domain-containing protein n=1 Tax=Scheffersomyces xylosifermentans TaxID=1304137 RepID=UPI00315CAF67